MKKNRKFEIVDTVEREREREREREHLFISDKIDYKKANKGITLLALIITIIILLILARSDTICIIWFRRNHNKINGSSRFSRN